MVLPMPWGWAGVRGGVRTAGLALGSASPFPNLFVEASLVLRMGSLPATSPHASHSTHDLRLGGLEGSEESISVSFVLVQASALLERTLGSETEDLTLVLVLFLAP